MSDRPGFPLGGRRVVRPALARPCPDCGELAGRGYPGCAECVAVVDELWLADWRALLTECDVTPDAEQSFAERVVAAEVGMFPWTCLDWAMAEIVCPACAAELGGGPVGCVLCRVADETRWAWVHSAPPQAITANEHALREARVVLRAPHRYRATVVLNWRLSLPFLLTGELADRPGSQWIRAYLRAGRYDELAAASSLTQLAHLRDLPWR